MARPTEEPAEEPDGDPTEHPGADPTSDLTSDLTERQRAAVIDPAPCLAILAGAGTGKTRVLTRRIAHRSVTGSADPRRVLALTFTRRAADELRHRLGRLGLRDRPAAGTFHAVAYAQLRTRWAERGVRPPSLLERPAAVLGRLVPDDLSPAVLAALVGEVAWARARMIGPDRYEQAAAEAARTPPLPAASMAELLDRYRTEKRRRRLVDFDDLLELAARDLDADSAFAAARRWRFRHVFVDEFQDVNPLQFRLLRAWVGDEPDLCVVGDANQAIYGWNGAEPGFLREVRRHLPGVSVIELTDNFRSSPQVLAAAGAILATGGGLRSHRPEGPAPTVSHHDDEQAEAAAVARAVRDRHRPGTAWARQAVLVRTNGQLGPIADALAAAGIPHRVRAGPPPLSDPVVARWLGELARSTSPMEVVLADLRAANVAEPSDGLTLLVGLAESCSAIDAEADGAAFATWVRAAVRDEPPPVLGDAVELVTFHAAKGLEWPIVHLAGLEAGLVPHARAVTAEARGEERRLLFVALTRAGEELHLTWARRRRFGDRLVERAPSPLLGELRLAEAPPEPRPLASQAGTVPRLRFGTAADPLADALRSWRASAARRAGVLPVGVLSEQTLAALVEHRPGTVDQLASLPGIGPVKAARLGPEILQVIAAATRADAGAP